MKIWIVLASLLAAATCGVWLSYRSPAGHHSFREKAKLVSKSLAVGVMVYFSIMAIALIYLTIGAS